MLEAAGSCLTFQPLALELRWGSIPQSTVWTRLGIRPAIAGEHHARLCPGVEDVPMQTFVAPRAVAALPVPVLPGAAGGAGQRPHPGLRQPRADPQGDELWPVIAPAAVRRAVRGHQRLQDGHSP